MDRTDNFSWLIEDIDNSLILMLRDGKGMMGSYQVDSLKLNGFEEIRIKFANIVDLTNFVNYSTIRFVDSLNKDNIIDIPLNKLLDLYEASNEITDSVPKPLSLEELKAFAIYNNSLIKGGYALYSYKISDISEELNDIMIIAKKFATMNMNNKIEALEDINLINYVKTKDTDNKRR